MSQANLAPFVLVLFNVLKQVTKSPGRDFGQSHGVLPAEFRDPRKRLLLLALLQRYVALKPVGNKK